MADAIRKDFSLHRGEDRRIVVTLNADGAVTGWTSALYVRLKDDEAGDPLLTITGAISDAGSVSTPGVLTFTITEAQLLTLEKRGYFYTIKRTNSGYKRVLTYGIMRVLNDGEHEAA